ncbi:CYTH domain-containing protein [Phenylobacterium sp.]|jgi:inorganic triphosphatase YgiF|uniref:CYTH domain-containing protein n=1 Tax=Phenylobacterium sp. TaxID=1871053 RepID=UPI002F92C4B8
MSGSREIELKFLCAPADMAVVLAAAPAGEDETRHLTSVYFDTPDGALARAGASLRIREWDGCRVQTLKRGKGVSREEHEAPVEFFDPTFGPLPELLSEPQRATLTPTLEVRITRRQRLVRYEGAEIELAADLGEVEAEGRTRPISELELELKSGPRKALFALARELRRAAPLKLSFESKSSQGRALLKS